jgi:hypothetical protein
MRERERETERLSKKEKEKRCESILENTKRLHKYIMVASYILGKRKTE